MKRLAGWRVASVVGLVAFLIPACLALVTGTPGDSGTERAIVGVLLVLLCVLVGAAIALEAFHAHRDRDRDPPGP